MNTENKIIPEKIIVYGAGISGRGAAEVLARHGRTVYLYNDDAAVIYGDLTALLQERGGGLYCGADAYAKLLAQAKLEVLSPGVPCDKQEVLAAEAQGLEVISEVELASRLYRGHIAAITGTNGKTTTTTLTGEIFKKLQVPSAVGGNIGLALSKEAEHLPQDAWLAAELSSFQLEKTSGFAPDIAVVLNLTPDHLERHHTMEAYGAAKKRIFLNQNAAQVTVLNYDDDEVRSWAAESRAQICYFSRKTVLEQGIFVKDGSFVIKWNDKEIPVCRVDECSLFGGHNEENIMAAIACGYFAGVDAAAMAEVLRSFKAVEHRLEYVASIGGVKYYNDSKATNTDSVIKALEAFPEGHIILLAGGHDKLTELEPLMACVKKYTDALILLGEAKERFNEAAQAAGVKNIYLADNFAGAVQLAHKIARAPQTVLLSPACSSFDMFKNYPERGRCFKRLVWELAGAQNGQE